MQRRGQKYRSKFTSNKHVFKFIVENCNCAEESILQKPIFILMKEHRDNASQNHLLKSYSCVLQESELSISTDSYKTQIRPLRCQTTRNKWERKNPTQCTCSTRHCRTNTDACRFWLGTYTKTEISQPMISDDRFEINLLLRAVYWNIIVFRGNGPTAVESKISYLLSDSSTSNKQNIVWYLTR